MMGSDFATVVVFDSSRTFKAKISEFKSAPYHLIYSSKQVLWPIDIYKRCNCIFIIVKVESVRSCSLYRQPRIVPKGALALLVSRSRELQYCLTLRHTCLSLITTWNIALHNQHPGLAIPIILHSLTSLSAACLSARHSRYCAQIPAFQCAVLVRQLNQIGHPGSHWRALQLSPALCSRSHYRIGK